MLSGMPSRMQSKSLALSDRSRSPGFSGGSRATDQTT